MKSVRLSALLALSLLGLPACDDSNSDTADTAGTEGIDLPSGAVCPEEGSKLTYENFAKGFFDSYCVLCHDSNKKTLGERNGATLGADFNNLKNIKLVDAGNIDGRAGDGASEMPLAGSPQPSEADRKKLSEWLACGTP